LEPAQDLLDRHLALRLDGDLLGDPLTLLGGGALQPEDGDAAGTLDVQIEPFGGHPAAGRHDAARLERKAGRTPQPRIGEMEVEGARSLGSADDDAQSQVLAADEGP